MTSTSRFDRRFAAQLLALAALFLCISAWAEPALKTILLKIGPHPLRVEVAASDPERMKGLMFREKMGRDDGMLFVFDEPAYQSMWMKNTLIPLSVAFLDADGTILNILDMEPHDLSSHTSAGPSIYAIETNRGWFASKGIKAGDKVAGLPKRRAG
jgi:uncharacterized membrane protein (UPF0127 family)